MDIATIDLASSGSIGGDEVLKPAKAIIAEAIPAKDGFHAQFAVPGMIPKMVAYSYAPSTPIIFPSERAATQAAREAVETIVNNGKANVRPPSLSKHVFVEPTEVEGNGYTVRYAYPGSTDQYITTDGRRRVFTGLDASLLTARDAAELAGLRALVGRWNRHISTEVRSQNYHGNKPLPHEFKAALDEAYPLDSALYATLRLSRPQRIEDWAAGAEDAPLSSLWELKLLSKPGAVEEALEVMLPHLREKPSLARFKAAIREYKKLWGLVHERIESERALMKSWEVENSGMEHRMKQTIALFDSLSDDDSDMNMKQRREHLDTIAGQLGITFDVNAEIMKQNQPRFEEIQRKRYARAARERIEVKEINEKRAAGLREERERRADEKKRPYVAKAPSRERLTDDPGRER